MHSDVVEALTWLAEQRTTEETLFAKDSPFSRATPEERLNIIAVRKDKHDRAVLTARKALASLAPPEGLAGELAKQAIDNSISRLRALHDYAGRPAWDEIVADEIGKVLSALTASDVVEALRLSRNCLTGLPDPEHIEHCVAKIDDALASLAPPEGLAARDDVLEEEEADFLTGLADRISRNLTPAQGFDQGDSDRLYSMARALKGVPQP